MKPTSRAVLHLNLFVVTAFAMKLKPKIWQNWSGLSKIGENFCFVLFFRSHSSCHCRSNFSKCIKPKVVARDRNGEWPRWLFGWNLFMQMFGQRSVSMLFECSVNKSDAVTRTNCILCTLCGQNIACNDNYYKPKCTVNISINSSYGHSATPSCAYHRTTSCRLFGASERTICSTTSIL